MIEISGAGVLLEKNKILLANHFKENQSYWVLPGGQVEFMENLRNTVVREVLEESGLQVKAGKFLFFQEIILKNKRHILNFYFLLARKGGRLVKVAEETLRGVKFIPVKNLKKIDFRPRRLLPHLIKELKNNFENCPQFLI